MASLPRLPPGRSPFSPYLLWLAVFPRCIRPRYGGDRSKPNHPCRDILSRDGSAPARHSDRVTIDSARVRRVGRGSSAHPPARRRLIIGPRAVVASAIAVV